jgi:hypothetical protein
MEKLQIAVFFLNRLYKYLRGRFQVDLRRSHVVVVMVTAQQRRMTHIGN